jgi:asparagine synthase (glutamine-hydrolysing)
MYTHAYAHTPYADEKEFFDTVSARCHHLPATLIPSDELWALKEFGEENQFPLDEPEYSALRIHTLTFIRSIKEDGCHVIIGGDGGDMVFTTDAYRYGLFLKDLPLKHMLSELPYFWPIAKPHKIVLPSRRVIEYGNFFTIIPKKMAIYLKNRAMRNQMPDFLLPVCDDTDSLVDLLPPSGLKTMSALSVYDSVTNGFNSAMLIALDTTAANCSTERRYPFYDRRIIDFLLSLPPYLSFRKGYSRYILRQVMSGLLPEEVRCRLSKSSVQGLILRGFHQKEKSKIQLLIDESIAVKMGLVHADHLLTAWNSFWAEGGIYTKDLAHFLCAETWLRYQERIRTNKSGS